MQRSSDGAVGRPRPLDGRIVSQIKQGGRKSSPKGAVKFLAEAVGFEPTVPRGTTVFKTAAFNHSATPPSKP